MHILPLAPSVVSLKEIPSKNLPISVKISLVKHKRIIPFFIKMLKSPWGVKPLSGSFCSINLRSSLSVELKCTTSIFAKTIKGEELIA